MGLVCSRGVEISEPRNESLISIKSNTSSPIRYFDLLPPELVLQIVEDIGKPHTGGRQTRVKRREAKATLRSLCLTSKRFKEIAQPLLLSTVDLGQGEQMLSLLTERNGPDALAFIRRIDCEPKLFTEPLSPEAVRYLVLYAVQLQNASLRDRGIELSVLAGSNLLILSFSVYKFSAQSTPQIRLPNLKYLTCLCCSFEGGGTPFDLPVLRHLVFTYEEAGISAGAISFLDQVSFPLLSITVNRPPLSALPPSILRSRQILRCYVVGSSLQSHSSHLDELQNLAVAHWIHVDTILSPPYDAISPLLLEEHLEKISDLLAKGAPNLQVISLVESRDLPSSTSLEISRMVQICRDRGLKVFQRENLKISEDQNLSIFDEASLSPFTRWLEKDSIRSSVAVDL